MRIENLDIHNLSIGVLFFEDYNAPYIESIHDELELVIQAFRPMLDKVGKIERLIEDSEKLKEGNLYGNCIGENETIISFKDGYFQFYSIVLSPKTYLELRESIWIELLKKIKQFMVKQNGKIFIARF